VGKGISGPNALIRPLVDECPVFKLCMVLCRGRVQTVYDLTEIDRAPKISRRGNWAPGEDTVGTKPPEIGRLNKAKFSCRIAETLQE
jgi:hypothetical protein